MSFESDGIIFVTEAPKVLCVRETELLGRRYRAQETRIMRYLYENMKDSFPDLRLGELKSKLGKPSIDLCCGAVSYLYRDLDKSHIISFRFDDKFRKLARFTMDG